MTPFAPHGFGSILESAAVLFFAYTGYARLTILGEEVRDPARTIPGPSSWPWASPCYSTLRSSLAAIGVIGAEGMSEKLADAPAPLHHAAAALPQPWIGLAIGVGATTAMLGVLLSQLLGISPMLFAMARRPRPTGSLAHVPPSTGVPDRGVLLAGLIAMLLAAVGTLTAITSAAAFTILLYYVITNLAARLAAADRLYPRAFAWLGLATSLGLAAALPWRTIGLGLALLAGGVVARVAVRGIVPR